MPVRRGLHPFGKPFRTPFRKIPTGLYIVRLSDSPNGFGEGKKKGGPLAGSAFAQDRAAVYRPESLNPGRRTLNLYISASQSGRAS